ncbi:hypothetical protein BDV97DRAFT_147679 [Delphinella strobiligena]|nr:hypothetical protein BDV97DRAFT_147679 [Delphinella strobiligena]
MARYHPAVRFAPNPVTAVSRELYEHELRALLRLEEHILSCDRCYNTITWPVRTHLALCRNGERHARLLQRYMYNESSDRIYSTSCAGTTRVHIGNVPAFRLSYLYLKRASRTLPQSPLQRYSSTISPSLEDTSPLIGDYGFERRQYCRRETVSRRIVWEVVVYVKRWILSI